MFPYLKYTIIILLGTVEFSYNISVIGIEDAKRPNEPLLFLPRMKKSNLRTEGIFVRFLRNLLELLTTSFPEKKLPKYCRILSKHVIELDYRHAKNLAKHLKYLSRMYRDDLKNELIFYKQEIDKKRQHRIDFLEAMNNVFTLQEHIRFEDYIYELKNYGTDDKLYIDEETNKLLNDVVIKSILRLSTPDRRELQKKLKNAIKEFKHDWGD